ncbi:MAG TPA: MFS transporter [Chitinispirillaceae bacterium]|nr:MFS transporter [Chitinispirillaceae bacterium]
MASNKKSVISWCFYDWANSAFALTVMAGFFPVFFKSYWCAGVEATVSTARLGFGNAAAGLAVALLSPFLGALADSGRAKKKLMAFFILLGSIATGLLFYISQGDWFNALAVFALASVGFNCANLFYDSLIVDVAEKEKMDMVSSMGYSMGYLGCGLLFLFNVFMVQKPSLFGLDSAAAAVKTSFMIASIWWLLFSIPLFLFVHERVYSSIAGVFAIFSDSIRRLRKTTIKIIKTRSLLLFFLAYWLYIDGVHTFVLMAVDFGMSIHLSASSLMVALLVVQFVAFPAALLFGLLARRFGAYAMIMAGVVIYILVSGIGSLILKTQIDYIILAGITGLAQGGIQALSRSYFGKIIPQQESAEYFGYYNVVSRFAVIFGPAVVGSVAFLTRKAGLESVLASRIGMSSVSILFLAGAVLLVLANKKGGVLVSHGND